MFHIYRTHVDICVLRCNHSFNFYMLTIIRKILLSKYLLESKSLSENITTIKYEIKVFSKNKIFSLCI